MKKEVLGLKYDNLTFSETEKYICSRLREKEKTAVFTVNAEIAYMAYRDKNFASVLNGGDVLTPDGAGVILASKLSGSPLKERVAGYDLGLSVLEYASLEGKSVFFLGGKENVARTAAEKMTDKFPNLKIAGTRNGYFAKEETRAVIDEINNVNPDILFVCLGAPKQEMWISENKEKVNATLFLGLGGSLDGYAGVVKRAPDIFIKLRLEWFYRLIKQPKRFGRMLSIPKYLFVALTHRS